uniref:Uncharacterized protein n=1 Tax=Hanusia phi TaxID=3032 RepID=A0A7S0F4F9_9CRYP|eukprot:765260-Hanusia_phi.AAC.11
MQAAGRGMRGAVRVMMTKMKTRHHFRPSSKLSSTLSVLSRTSRSPCARFPFPLCPVPGVMPQAFLSQYRHTCAGAISKRPFSNQNDLDLNCKLQDIDEQFVEARELLADALDSFGSTYFEEDLDDAQDMVEKCLYTYNALLQELEDEQRNAVKRGMGMKMEQLKQELQSVLDMLTHDKEPERPKQD